MNLRDSSYTWRYQNQRYHDVLSWPQTIAPLEELASMAPLPGLFHIGDIDDPRPWLEAYTAGVGSPLELKFLHLFQQHGFNPQKQVPVSPDGATSPIRSPKSVCQTGAAKFGQIGYSGVRLPSRADDSA